MCVPQWLRNVDRTLKQTHSAQGLSQSLSLLLAFEHGRHAPGPIAPDSGRRALDTGPVLQGSDRVGKGVELGIWKDRCNRHRSLPATLSRARVGVRQQPAPAAPRLQISHTILTQGRLVCRSRSGPLRAGTSPNHRDHKGRSWNPGVLALNGAWNAAVRCAPGAARSLLSEAVSLATLYTLATQTTK